MNKKKTIAVIVIAGILGLVLLAGVLIPVLAKHYINRSLTQIAGYTGSIDQVGISLFQGAYSVQKFKLDKTEADDPAQFILIDTINFSVQWRALLRGSVVSDIELVQPTVNFAKGKDTTGNQFGQQVDWVEMVKKLTPVSIDRLSIHQGSVRYLDSYSTPKVDITLHDIEMELLNLRNVEDKDNPLPSTVKITARSIGNGNFSLDGRLNALKTIPDLDLNLSIENVSVKALNDFLKAYANIDAERGVFNLYSEVVLANSQLSGYIKPLVVDLKLLSLKKDIKQPLQALWEGIVGAVTEVFENQEKDQFGSKVPLTGTIENAEIGAMPALLSILSNAFLEGLKKQTDNDVDFNSAE